MNKSTETRANVTLIGSRRAGFGTFMLLLILTPLLLSACGAKPTDSAASQAAGGQAGSGGAAEKSVTLTVSAAASLTDALTDIQNRYEAAQPNIKLEFNFGASGALQQQIEQGAPADLFLSASNHNMQALLNAGLIEAEQEKDWLANTLVVVVPVGGSFSAAKIEDLVGETARHVAIGIPDSVPAGRYAQEALTQANLWDSLQHKLVQGKDVRQVLQYVETGNADAGFVYKTDALTSDNVQIAFDVDPDSYSPIHYPIGIVKATKNQEAAHNFYDYLQTPEALDILTEYGFSAAK